MFVQVNMSIKVLDLSRNEFSEGGNDIGIGLGKKKRLISLRNINYSIINLRNYKSNFLEKFLIGYQILFV